MKRRSILSYGIYMDLRGKNMKELRESIKVAKIKLLKQVKMGVRRKRSLRNRQEVLRRSVFRHRRRNEHGF